MGTNEALTQWALYLAAMGWHVFPLAAGTKRPAVTDWEHRATTDCQRITRCWSAGRYNIGIATGPSELVVIDLDTAKPGEMGSEGVTTFAELAAQRGTDIPDTYTVTTPSGGRHLYLTAPPGVVLRNSAGHLGTRIDTRAAGGYVVAPGSVLPNGAYELLDDTDPAELPAWLVQACLERPAHANSWLAENAVTHHGAYVTTAIRDECARVRQALSGQHNAVLSNAAYNLGQVVGAELLDADTARAELQAAAHALITADCDCTPGETDRVITAGLAAGARKPRGHHGKEAA